ncbi:MAG: hypothetical protein KAU44_02905 [Candidatus Marinimicrobia bacterium]|nr:hypothetical protein [Candidatus Neomarinimicrobiota bacterium]
MKKALLLLIILSIFCLPLLAEDSDDSPWNIYTELDMYLGFKMGIKYEINDRLDFISAFGLNLFEPTRYCYSVFASYHTMSDYNNFIVDVNFGIIHGEFDNTSTEVDDYVIVSPGASMHLSYPLTKKIRIGLQGGMVLMIGYNSNGWGGSLEPYTGLTFTFAE